MRSPLILLAASAIALTAACSSSDSGAPATVSHSSTTSAPTGRPPVSSAAASALGSISAASPSALTPHPASATASGLETRTTSHDAVTQSAQSHSPAKTTAHAPHTSPRRSSEGVARDANGFALGGPPYPTLASHPSTGQCLTYRNALVAWSNYQNQHRPAGSSNDLPTSGDVQNLYATCSLDYPFPG